VNDQQLIQASIEGNQKAQRLFFEKYTKQLFVASMRYSKNRMDAEDALQEAWINIFKSLGKYREEGKLLGWMKRIVINAALRKKQSSWFKNEEIGLQNSREAKLSPVAIDTMSANEILDHVLNLPPGYKEVFTLFVIDGYSHKEIGDLLNIKASTSRSKLTLARRKMQQSILKGNKIYAYVS